MVLNKELYLQEPWEKSKKGKVLRYTTGLSRTFGSLDHRKPIEKDTQSKNKLQ